MIDRIINLMETLFLIIFISMCTSYIVFRVTHIFFTIEIKRKMHQPTEWLDKIEGEDIE